MQANVGKCRHKIIVIGCLLLCKVGYTKGMKLKIEIPTTCRYIFLDYNNSWFNAKSSTEAEKYIRYNRLEIVGESVFGDMYIVKVRKADSFL